MVFVRERKRRHGILGLCLVLVLALLAGCGGQDQAQFAGNGSSPPTQEELWEAAVADAVFSEDEEVLELVCLTENDPQVMWDQAGQRVLLVTWHNWEEPCQPGQGLPAGEEEIWATSLGEMVAWYQANGSGVTDWDLRFAQLLGVPNDGSYTRFTAFWITPDQVIRPAYVTDVTAQMQNDYGLVTDPAYREWFDGNIIASYFAGDYPWTRLGYTYDWSGGESEYGLTEFLLSGQSEAEIAFTYDTQDFVAWLTQQADGSEA